jgi:hypothetical protein
MRAEKIEVGESSLERRVVLQDQHGPRTDPSDREKLGNGDRVMRGIVNGMTDDVLVCTKDGYCMERNWTKCSQVPALEVRSVPVRMRSPLQKHHSPGLQT